MKKCVICKRKYEEFGNNAEPFTRGRCCDYCNYTKVIPIRLSILQQSR